MTESRPLKYWYDTNHGANKAIISLDVPLHRLWLEIGTAQLRAGRCLCLIPGMNPLHKRSPERRKQNLIIPFTIVLVGDDACHTYLTSVRLSAFFR